MKNITKVFILFSSFIFSYQIMCNINFSAQQNKKLISNNNYLPIHYQSSITALCFYGLLIYCSDSSIHYKHQICIMKNMTHLKKIIEYLAISHGIYNFLRLDNSFLFFNQITNNTGYTFHDFTLYILKIYQELKNTLHFFKISKDSQSEASIFLCHASLITIPKMLYLASDNPILYKKITLFEKNEIDQRAWLINYIKEQIFEHFLDIQKNSKDIGIII